MRRVLLLVLVAGCHSDGNDYPVTTGGGGFGGGQPQIADAGVDGGDGGALILGRVCLMTDPRDQTSCAATGVGGLVVTLGTATGTTADDGTFTVGRPSGSNIVWDVTGSTVLESLTPFTAQAIIPAMPLGLYAQLEADNGVIAQAGQGAVMLRVLQAGAPLVGATATITPPTVYGTFYDGSTPATWTANGTGAFGTAWMPGEVTGTADVTVTPQGGTATTLGAVPIKEAAITFLTEELP